jgi:DNA-binding NarL/FixJ family response regulator
VIDSDVIRVLIIDDHEMFSDGISRILGDEADMDVVGAATTLERGIAMARVVRPSVVLADYNLPDSQGSQGVQMILEASPQTRVIVLTGSTDARTLTEAVAAGCRGYVTKDRASDELVQAVRFVHAGEVFITQRMLAGLLPKFNRPTARLGGDLTERELSILQRMTEGLSNQEIADRLYLSVHTIRNHVQNVLSKLRAHSRLEAVIIANREGLLEGRLRVLDPSVRAN